MGIDRIKRDRMDHLAREVPVYRVRVGTALNRSGKPAKWLAHYKEAQGKFAVREVVTNSTTERVTTKFGYYERKIGLESMSEFVFTHADTAFMFAMHFRGVQA